MEKRKEVLERNYLLAVEQIKRKKNEIIKLEEETCKYQCLLRESGAPRVRENIYNGITHAVNTKSIYRTMCGIRHFSVDYIRYGAGPTCKNCIKILKAKERRSKNA